MKKGTNNRRLTKGNLREDISPGDQKQLWQDHRKDQRESKLEQIMNILKELPVDVKDITKNNTNFENNQQN